jgi:diguanylate cyclase (GGDEF)-like protein/PAS domain S-box-containing protein
MEGARVHTESSQLARDIYAAQEFDQAFELAAVGMALINMDGNVVVRANRAWCEMFGWSREEMIGKTNADLTHPDDLPASLDRLQRLRTVGENLQAEKRVVRKDGSWFWALVSTSIILDATGHPQFVFSQVQDITALKDLQALLEQRASHDALTGLPNRSAIEAKIRLALSGMRREPVSVLFIDLDGFKALNDEHGHQTADALLTALARDLVTALRPGDSVGRWGGDEFVVLCPGLPAGLVDTIVERIKAALAANHIGASIGRSSADPDADVTFEAFMHTADLDMYEHKRAHRALNSRH